MSAMRRLWNILSTRLVYIGFYAVCVVASEIEINCRFSHDFSSYIEFHRMLEPRRFWEYWHEALDFTQKSVECPWCPRCIVLKYWLRRATRVRRIHNGQRLAEADGPLRYFRPLSTLALVFLLVHEHSSTRFPSCT